MSETGLLKSLLKASHAPNEKVLDALLGAVSSEIPSIMCSLWKLNLNSKIASLLSRIDYSPPDGRLREFVHPLEGSLIGHILEKSNLEKKLYYKICVKNKYFRNLHKSPKRIDDLHLDNLISIPIPCHDSEWYEKEAILNIYTKENFKFNQNLAEIIVDQFSLIFSRLRLINKESLTSEIIDIYEQRGAKDLASVLHPIITSTLRKYIRYEGSSIFLWDKLWNRLSLTQTTGIATKPKKEKVYYYLGEGLTGKIAEFKKPAIIDDLKNITNPLFEDCHEIKWIERTERAGKSFMGIPIMSPSRPDELLGVIRFTNCLNRVGNAIDCFSMQDYDLVKHACNLIALYMEYDINEKVSAAFAKQMAHEMLAPAVAIRGSADRLYKNWNNNRLPDRKIKDYLSSIFDHADLQISLSRNIQYAWQGSGTSSKKQRYQISEFCLHDDVIKSCHKLIIPLARRESLQFSNIKIVGSFPKVYIDKFAFQQIFFNILINAIKYRHVDRPQSFSVEIKCLDKGHFEVPDTASKKNTTTTSRKHGLVIQVKDEGTGVPAAESEKIFLLGYRKKDIEKTDVRGLGLGLAVARSLLSDFYSSIWLENTNNPTVFNIFLPSELFSKKYVYESDWNNT